MGICDKVKKNIRNSGFCIPIGVYVSGVAKACQWYGKICTVPNGRDNILNVGKALYCLGEPGNSVFCIAMFDSVADAVADMAFKNHLANPVQGRLGSVNLGEDVLAGNILVNHAVYGLDLSYDFVETAVQVCLVHALLHKKYAGQLRLRSA